MINKIAHRNRQFLVDEPLETRFEEMINTIAHFGLNVFADWHAHDCFDKSYLDELTNEEKEKFIKVCTPMVTNALLHGRKLQ